MSIVGLVIMMGISFEWCRAFLKKQFPIISQDPDSFGGWMLFPISDPSLLMGLSQLEIFSRALSKPMEHIYVSGFRGKKKWYTLEQPEWRKPPEDLEGATEWP